MNIPILASKLDLSNKGLTEFPTEIFKCKNLKKLNLSNNKIKSIPADLCKLKYLKSLDISNNEISILMAKTFLLKKLEVLVLNNNHLKKLPIQISELTLLKTLAIAGNQLTNLPYELTKLTNLRSLNLANNLFTKFPSTLLQMEAIEKLWLNKNPLINFPSTNIKLTLPKLKALYCFSSMFKIEDNIDPVYSELQKQKGNCLNTMELLSLRVKVNERKHRNTPIKNNNSTSPKFIFVSYSHSDVEWLPRIKTLFAAMGYEDLNLDFWDDTRLKGGDLWEHEIETAVKKANIAVLLISDSFLGSNFIRLKELPTLLDNAEAKGTIILPVIIRLSRYTSSPLKKYQTLNSPLKPLNKMSMAEQDEVFYELGNRIENLSRT